MIHQIGRELRQQIHYFSGELCHGLGTVVCRMLAMHALNAAKRLFAIPDFRYYALADGISAIFKRIGKGPVHPRGHKPAPSPQLPLW